MDQDTCYIEDGMFADELANVNDAHPVPTNLIDIGAYPYDYDSTHCCKIGIIDEKTFSGFSWWIRK